MGTPLFISQSKLEGWIDDGEVTFDDGILTLLAQRRSYRLVPAVQVSLLLDGEDTQSLVGKILALDELAKLGAEHYPRSVLLGETAYECVDGFLGVEPPIATPPSAAVAPPPAATVAAAEKSDTELLVDFLLKHL